MPGVADVAVVGIPGGDLGETVVAAVVLEPARRASTSSPSARGASSTWRATRCRAGSWSLDELPRSQVGKVLRRAVRESVLARLRLTSRGRATRRRCGALGAERRVAAVARVDPGVVVEPVEDALRRRRR